MMTWAVTLDAADAERLGCLRLVDGLRVARIADDLWLLGGDLEPSQQRLVDLLPCRERFRVVGNGKLIPIGRRLPERRLPSADWLPLARWLVPTLPKDPIADGFLPSTISLAVIRSGKVRDTAAMIIGLRNFQKWVEWAPSIRIRALLHAVSDDDRVFVTGTPFPSIDGERFWVDDGIMIPLGFELSPNLPAKVTRQLLQLPPNDVAVFHQDATWEKIAVDDLVPLTRSGLRMVEAP